MYNLYYKDFSANLDELDETKKLFNENGLDLNIVFEHYANLPLTSVKTLNSTLTDAFRHANPMGQKANLICNAMGCNLGILTAYKNKRIKSLTLIAPEFGNYTADEQKQIDYEKGDEKIARPYGEEKAKLSKEKIKKLILSNKTQSLAKIAIEKINVPTLIIYSKDDAFIAKEYLDDLAQRKNNIQIATVQTKMHNPLKNKNEKEKVMRLIKKHIRWK